MFSESPKGRSGKSSHFLPAAPALAADEVSIDHVEAIGGVVSMVVSVDGVPGSDVGGSDHHNRARDPALRDPSSRRIDHKCPLLSLHDLAVCV